MIGAKHKFIMLQTIQLIKGIKDRKFNGTFLSDASLYIL
jgi:hypothetical protein